MRGADASRIRKLAKPTSVAWAINQVYWKTRRAYDEVLKSGERVRKAQVAALEGRKSDVREASDAHRRAIADAVKEAQRLAAAAGSQPGADALMRTFEALSLASEPPEPPGRLTRELQPAGFEALTGVTPKPVERGAAPKAAERPAAPPAPPVDLKLLEKQQKQAEARKAAEETKRLAEEKKREAAIKKAEAAVERAKKQMLAAQESLKRTREGLH